MSVLTAPVKVAVEDAPEYRDLVAVLVAEHAPQGPTRSIWSRN